MPPQPGPSTSSSINIKAIGNSGSSTNYMSTQLLHSNVMSNVQRAHPSVPVEMANESIIHSSHQAELFLPSFLAQARITHLFPDLESHSLLSIGQLCDAGCIALLDKSAIYIVHPEQQQLILTGARDQATKLWHIDLPTKESTAPAPFTTNNIASSAQTTSSNNDQHQTTTASEITLSDSQNSASGAPSKNPSTTRRSRRRPAQRQRRRQRPQQPPTAQLRLQPTPRLPPLPLQQSQPRLFMSPAPLQPNITPPNRTKWSLSPTVPSFHQPSAPCKKP